jgi:hypothetical protein
VDDAVEALLVEAAPVAELGATAGATGALELVALEVPSPVALVEVEVALGAAFGACAGFALRPDGTGLAGATGIAGAGALSAGWSTGATGTGTLSAEGPFGAATTYPAGSTEEAVGAPEAPALARACVCRAGWW